MLLNTTKGAQKEFNGDVNAGFRDKVKNNMME